MSECYTLEQLKAMSDKELNHTWGNYLFPFDGARGCGTCLTVHANGGCSFEEHSSVMDSMQHLPAVDYSWDFAANMRPHLEELYALRLFYDHLYPQPAEQESQLPSSFAAKPGVEGGQQPGTDALESMVDSDRDWSANTR